MSVASEWNDTLAPFDWARKCPACLQPGAAMAYLIYESHKVSVGFLRCVCMFCNYSWDMSPAFEGHAQ